MRFASDELGRNYYEYKARVPERAGLIDWSEVKLELTALSNLKLAPNFPANDPILYQVPGPHGMNKCGRTNTIKIPNSKMAERKFKLLLAAS